MTNETITRLPSVWANTHPTLADLVLQAVENLNRAVELERAAPEDDVSAAGEEGVALADKIEDLLEGAVVMFWHTVVEAQRAGARVADLVELTGFDEYVIREMVARFVNVTYDEGFLILADEVSSLLDDEANTNAAPAWNELT